MQLSAARVQCGTQHLGEARGLQQGRQLATMLRLGDGTVRAWRRHWSSSGGDASTRAPSQRRSRSNRRRAKRKAVEAHLEEASNDSEVEDEGEGVGEEEAAVPLAPMPRLSLSRYFAEAAAGGWVAYRHQSPTGGPPEGSFGSSGSSGGNFGGGSNSCGACGGDDTPPALAAATGAAASGAGLSLSRQLF